jgi:hypothetical protein
MSKPLSLAKTKVLSGISREFMVNLSEVQPSNYEFFRCLDLKARKGMLTNSSSISSFIFTEADYVVPVEENFYFNFKYFYLSTLYFFFYHLQDLIFEVVRVDDNTKPAEDLLATAFHSNMYVRFLGITKIMPWDFFFKLQTLFSVRVPTQMYFQEFKNW